MKRALLAFLAVACFGRTNQPAEERPALAKGDESKIFLMSVSVDLAPNESLREFAIDTWGIQYEAVCHIPLGWRVEAGASATLDGVTKGEGSHGATWLNRESLNELQDVVLITMFAPVQQDDRRDKSGAVIIPATFKGKAVVETGDGERQVALSHRNVRLTPAVGCPTVPARRK
jgi:hypothetical protein